METSTAFACSLTFVPIIRAVKIADENESLLNYKINGAILNE